MVQSDGGIMKKKRQTVSKRHWAKGARCGKAAFLLSACVGSASMAAPLPLSKAPPGGSMREPVPNVIVTVDDSGSMSSRVAGSSKTKIQALKEVLWRQFGNGTHKGRIEDDRLRLAWQSMNDHPGIPAGGTRSMKSLSGAHRQNFVTFVNGLRASGGTPSGAMLVNALNYMRTPKGLNSPWADTPGVAQNTPYAACRRAYHIFLTDGIGSRPGARSTGDGVVQTFPDGNRYEPGAEQSRVYRDGFSSTMADVAFEAWATDLQPDISNGVRPIVRKAGTETFGSTVLQEYWNPKNDPATWQHLNTYTIGFGAESYTWSGEPIWDKVGNDTYGGSYSKLVTGQVQWGNQVAAELWHIAINSRAKFYPALNDTALDKAFDEIFDNIIDDTSKPIGSLVASARSLSNGLLAYKSTYATANWSGSVIANAVDGLTGGVSTQETWNAAALLDQPSYDWSSRFILSFNGTSGFAWNNFNSLPAVVRAKLNTNSAGVTDNLGTARHAFLRGDRSREKNQASGVFRERASRLGDIVNSGLWYVGRPNANISENGYSSFRSNYSNRLPMVYVGGNDGMLHGFAGATNSNGSIVGGSERLAFVPQGVAEGELRRLTDPDYTHRYFVDGSPFSGDVYLGASTGWRTLLIGTLGLGGKGYFALDITDPSRFSNANAASLVLLDSTATADRDIGHITAAPVMDEAVDAQSPQIVKLNNNRWAVILGNGYNSTNEAPVLLVQYLDGDRALLKLSPCRLPVEATACTFKGTNGLSAPTTVDANADGKVDVVYAGDIQGHVWRFDLNSADDQQWHAAFEAQPLFVAKAADGQRLPITAAPYWLPHPNGGIMLTFGTGVALTDADRTSARVNMILGLHDISKFQSGTGGVAVTDGVVINSTAGNGMPSNLVQQTITGNLTHNGKKYFTGSSNPVNYGGASPHRGWFLAMPHTGQRLIHNPYLWTSSMVAVPTVVPSTGSTEVDACKVGVSPEVSYPFILNAYSGTPSAKPLVDIGNNAIIGYETGTREHVFRDRDGLVAANPDGKGVDKFTVSKTMGQRLSWREIQ